jgi:hypothetical protein
MTFDDLAKLPEETTGTCFDCGILLTDSNRAAAQQIRQDGKLQGFCQNCYRLDDVKHLDDLGKP